MRLPRRSLLLAALAACLVPASAEADPVISKPDGETLLIRSTANEANHIDTLRSGATLEIWETDAPGLDAGPCVQSSPASAECSLTGITRVRMELGPANDVVDEATHDVRLELFGQDGDDRLFGGAGGDLLNGGPGEDEALGLGGNDRLEMEDGVADTGFACGAGDDDADHDAFEPYGGECEVHAPEFEGTPSIGSSGSFQAFEQLLVNGIQYGVPSGEPFPMIATRWFRCEPGGACGAVAGEASGVYQLREADSGRTFYAEVDLANRAGTKASRTLTTPPIAPPVRFPTPPLPDERQILATFTTELGRSLKTATAQLARSDLRRLARRKKVRMALGLSWLGPMLTPQGGPVKITWTVPASVARRHGVRTTGRKPVTVAKGVSTGGLRLTTNVDVKPTKAGKRILRRAKRLKLDVASSLKVASQLRAVSARRSVTLKRRR